jgi:hypothetical protein
LGTSASLPWRRSSTNFEIANNWTKIAATHILKAGLRCPLGAVLSAADTDFQPTRPVYLHAGADDSERDRGDEQLRQFAGGICARRAERYRQGPDDYRADAEGPHLRGLLSGQMAGDAEADARSGRPMGILACILPASSRSVLQLRSEDEQSAGGRGGEGAHRYGGEELPAQYLPAAGDQLPAE